MKKILAKLNFLSGTTLIMLATACGGGGGGGGGSSAASSADEVLSSLTTGITVPKSISAIPADAEGTFAPSSARSVPRKSGNLRQALNSSGETDLERAGNLEMKVDVPALDQFSIIETIMSTLRQTNYWDSSVINKGAYKTLVRWEETGGSPDYQNWIINSKMIILDGADVNRVRFWIEGEGIKGKIDIFTAPSSSNIYGEWRLDVSMEPPEFAAMMEEAHTGTFTASSKLQNDGSVKLSINQNTGWVSKGILYLKNGEGQGVVEIPDDNCECEDTVEVKMAYNTDHAVIQKGSSSARCIDRNSFSDIYMDYSLFDSTGKNVNKTKVYSFPLKYEGEWYHYSGWEGRQQLWGYNAGDIPINATLVHADHDNDTQFTLASRIKGILTKKSGTDITSALDQIGTDVLQTNLWQDSLYFVLLYEGGAWKFCNEWEFHSGVCDSPQTLSDGTSGTIETTGGIFNKHGDNSNRVQVVAYDDMTWQDLISSSTDADNFTENLNQSKVYRVYVEKMLYLVYDSVQERIESCSPGASDFAADSWNPVTSTNRGSICTTDFDWTSLAQSWGDYSYHFWSSGGTQYLAKVDDLSGGTGLLSLMKTSTEVVSDAISGDLTAIDWSGTEGASYTFDSTKQLKQGTDVVTEWTDRLFDDAGNEYYWEYSNDGDWDVMTSLIYKTDPVQNGARIDKEVVFDEPIAFNDFTAKNVAGDDVTLGNLRYDGYFMGLPDVWSMLYDNRLTDSEAGLTPAQKARIVNIAPNTQITDSDPTSSDVYTVKPRFGLRLLDDVEVASCTSDGLAVPSALSLADIITFEDPELDDEPEIEDVIVIEGEFVDEL